MYRRGKATTPLIEQLAFSFFTGTYQGQWLRGMRHGYGVRTSAPFGLASHRPPPEGEATTAGTGGADATAPVPGAPALSVAASGGGGGLVPGLTGVRKKLGAIGRGSQHSLSGEDGAQPPLARRAVDAEGARGGFVLR